MDISNKVKEVSEISLNFMVSLTNPIPGNLRREKDGSEVMSILDFKATHILLSLKALEKLKLPNKFNGNYEELRGYP